MRSKFNLLFIYFFSTIFIASVPAVSAAADLKQVLILPFIINAEKDLAYLNRGMVSMLSSRLYHPDRVTTLTGDKPAPNLATALKLGANSGADFVVFGSITVFGKSVSTDLKLVNVENETAAITFSQSGNKKGAVISHIDQFAAQANAMFMQRPTVPTAAAPPAAAAVPVIVPVAPKAAPPEAAPTVAPEKPAPARPPEWKSDRFRRGVISLSAGDIDQDGKAEVVMVTQNEVLVRRYERSKLFTVAEVKGQKYLDLLGVDVLDLNNNGKPELFVTRKQKDGKLQSFVLEWNGGSLVKIADHLNWYFRVVNIPGKGKILLGQKRGVIMKGNFAKLDEPNELFLPGIHELKWQGDSLVSARRLDLPGSMKIYGFAWGDIQGKGQEQIVMLTDTYRLRVMDRSGRKEWTSSERYGGSASYIEYSTGNESTDTGYYYLPQRVHLEDMDGDGKIETVVVKNKDSARDLVGRVKIYNSGAVECLNWDAVAMKRKWITETASGYISDIAVADMDGDGTRDILFAVVGSGSLLDFEKTTTYLTIRWGGAAE